MPRPAGRSEIPDGYGVTEVGEYLDWRVVESRLRDARHYWLATTRPDGRPHVVPRWGVWLDERFWYDGSPQTRHVRNLATNQSCTLHLESGSEVTILDGLSKPAEPVGMELGGRLSAEFGRKYGEIGYAPGPESWSDEAAGGLVVFTPRTAIAWSSFPNDLTKFLFD